MKFRQLCQKKIAAVLIPFFILTIGCLKSIYVMPNQITLIEGNQHLYESPFFATVKAQNNHIVGISSVSANNTVEFIPLQKGITNLQIQALGIFPVKTVRVNVVPDKKVVAGGSTVGIKINFDGILVIGTSNVVDTSGKKIFPCKEVGIRPGDLIIELNHKKIKDIGELVEQLNSCNGMPLHIQYKRENKISNSIITPIKSADDNQYRLGLWVRDNTAGIGTLTFYDSETNKFGALGHGISDTDTGILMPISNGELLESNILMVNKGVPGYPGELKGIFVDGESNMGTLNKNCNYGIYGILTPEGISKLSNRSYSIALRDQVKEGSASILANISGKNVEEYNIQIQKISKYSFNNFKGMIIKITDERLLDTTGGIVQGMSGSPIIQDGKIIGAVTHVLVNDPTRGYGIFIEKMLEN